MCEGGTLATEAVTVCTTHVNKNRARWFLIIYRQVERRYNRVYGCMPRLVFSLLGGICYRLHKSPAATDGSVVLCTRFADHLLLHTILRPSRSTVVRYSLYYCLLVASHVSRLLFSCPLAATHVIAIRQVDRGS